MHVVTRSRTRFVLPATDALSLMFPVEFVVAVMRQNKVKCGRLHIWKMILFPRGIALPQPPDASPLDGFNRMVDVSPGPTSHRSRKRQKAYLQPPPHSHRAAAAPPSRLAPPPLLSQRPASAAVASPSTPSAAAAPPE
jgi:hypothetical protein